LNGVFVRPLSFGCEVRVWDVLAQAMDAELARLLACTQASSQVAGSGEREKGCSRWMRTPPSPATAAASSPVATGRQSRWMAGNAEGQASEPVVRRAVGMQRRQLINSYVQSKAALLESVRDNVLRRKEASLQQGGLVA
jgi:hypothetical protein